MHRSIAVLIMTPILIYIHPFWRMYFQNKKNILNYLNIRRFKCSKV